MVHIVINRGLEILKLLGSTSVHIDNVNYSSNLPDANSGGDVLRTVLNIVIAIIAALSVLFVVIGGLRYILAAGNPEAASKARSTIIYALIGLIISLLAEVIVAFVLTKLGSNGL